MRLPPFIKGCKAAYRLAENPGSVIFLDWELFSKSLGWHQYKTKHNLSKKSQREFGDGFREACEKIKGSAKE